MTHLDQQQVALSRPASGSRVVVCHGLGQERVRCVGLVTWYFWKSLLRRKVRLKFRCWDRWNSWCFLQGQARPLAGNSSEAAHWLEVSYMPCSHCIVRKSLRGTQSSHVSHRLHFQVYRNWLRLSAVFIWMAKDLQVDLVHLYRAFLQLLLWSAKLVSFYRSYCVAVKLILSEVAFPGTWLYQSSGILTLPKGCVTHLFARLNPSSNTPSGRRTCRTVSRTRGCWSVGRSTAEFSGQWFAWRFGPSSRCDWRTC